MPSPVRQLLKDADSTSSPGDARLDHDGSAQEIHGFFRGTETAGKCEVRDTHTCGVQAGHGEEFVVGDVDGSGVSDHDADAPRKIITGLGNQNQFVADCRDDCLYAE